MLIITSMKNILVLCTGNSCRSQIAHGYLKTFVADKANVYSAGVETHGVNPKAVATMLEDGIDISNHTSNNVLEYTGVDFDFAYHKPVYDNFSYDPVVGRHAMFTFYNESNASYFMLRWG